MRFIKEFEVEWAADNSIATLAFAPKKRSLTPYMLFAHAERKKLPNGGKGKKITESMSIIGKAWSECAEGGKDRFRDLSAYLMEKYCTNAVDEEGFALSGGKKKVKRGMKMLKGVNTQINIKPKKVISPYIAFVKKERPKLTKECPNLTFGEAMKFLGERWKEMTDEQKIPFVEASSRDQKRFNYEMNNGGGNGGGEPSIS